jgi:hypothetical protein
LGEGYEFPFACRLEVDDGRVYPNWCVIRMEEVERGPVAVISGVLQDELPPGVVHGREDGCSAVGEEVGVVQLTLLIVGQAWQASGVGLITERKGASVRLVWMLDKPCN